jgi:hypothetical protein
MVVANIRAVAAIVAELMSGSRTMHEAGLAAAYSTAI